MRPSTLILAAAFSAALSTTVLAADPVTLVGWDFTALEEVRTEVAPDFAVDGLQVSSISAGLGVGTLSSSSTKRFGGKNFVDVGYGDAVGNGRFFVFTVTVKPGYKASLKQIDKFRMTRSATGPTCGSWECRVLLAEYESFYSFNNESFESRTVDKVVLPGNLSDLQGGTSVEFRFVLWNASKEAGTFAFNDVKLDTYDIAISGTCEPVIDGDVTYPLTFDVQGGTLSSTNGFAVAAGTTSPVDLPAGVPVVFAAEEGKWLASVSTNGFPVANIDKAATSYTFVMIDDEVSVNVVFDTPPALTFAVEGGAASVNGEAISSPANLPAGTVVTFTADAGKKLSSVSIGGTPVEDIDTSATSYAYTMGDEEASLAVVFVEPPIEAIEICNGKTIAENFDSLGPAKATASSTLPSPWRVSSSDTAHDYSISYQAGTDSTTRSGGCDTSITYAGIYNFTTGQVDVASNRAVGFLSSDKACRTGLLAVPLKNTGTSTITELRMEYSVGKYKGNTRAKKIVLRLSDDGASWQECGDAFSTVFQADAAEEKYEAGGFPAPVKNYEYVKCRIEPGKTIFLGWFYDNAESTTGGDKPQALAVDDVRIRAGRPMCLILK